MARKSFTPLIRTTLETYPDLKDNYKKLAQKVGCCTKTITRYFENLDLKVQLDKSENHHSPEFIPPTIKQETKNLAHIIESIENPVAFASAHIFEKMLETGDVRWAQLYVSVLDKTNKLDYETSREQEWLRQAKDMSMEEIVSKVAMKGSTMRNISRQLERAESTSPYDNF